MRLIQRKNGDGKIHLSYVKDNDPDTAPGISADPPDIEQLDWEEIKKQIHNGLVEARILKLNDLQRSNSGLNGIILNALRRPILALYRSIEDG